jgi:hypothetical protein
MTPQSSRPRRPWAVAALVAGAILALSIFWSIGAHNMNWYQLRLGATTVMSTSYTYFLVFWALFGSITALLFGCAFARLAEASWAQETYEQLRGTPDRHLILAFSIIAFAVPALIHWRLLQGADLTDDESVYRFSAELLLGGRLYATSPPMKLFFDHVFMINDGKFYSQYFMGWPALLAPALALDVPGLANPLYSALTVPAIFLTLRELCGRRCAVVGVILFLSAPMVQFTAATQLSHTSCLFALAWMTYFTVRANRGDPTWWLHPGIAAAFSVAFFIRPTVAVSMGVPLLFVWAAAVRNVSPEKRWRAILTFAAPALLFAVAFLAVNALQNGSIAYVSYQRAGDYARENGFHYAAWSKLSDDWTPSFSFGAIDLAFARTGVALTRANFAFFGWPCAFVFLPFAFWRRHGAWIFWSMAIGFALVHSYLRSPGIDTFGPVHYMEIALPIILLTALGVTHLTNALRSWASPPFASRLPLALFFGLITASVFGYVPARAYALYDAADVIRRPAAAAQKIEGPAVVFVNRPFILRSCSVAQHFVFAQGLNDPDFQNQLLWVNHLSVEHDRRLMEHYPDRKGLIMLWGRDCEPFFISLEAAAADNLPDGHTGGSGPIPSPSEMR